MSNSILTTSFDIKKDDFLTAGEASAKIKKILKQIGISSEITRRVAIISYECELNLVIHSLGGSMQLDISPDCITITSRDNGPGIENIELALSEGWSTAPDSVRELGFGAGMGLPNMKRHTDDFFIESTPGLGTTIIMKIFLKDKLA